MLVKYHINQPGSLYKDRRYLKLFDVCALTKLHNSSSVNAANINKQRRIWLVKYSTDLGLNKIQGDGTAKAEKKSWE